MDFWAFLIALGVAFVATYFLVHFIIMITVGPLWAARGREDAARKLRWQPKISLWGWGHAIPYRIARRNFERRANR